ncbi:MAG: cytochrome c [Nitrosomonadales bacterium]|nr:cytochrome c [Nitrosomonadales bacterium]
MKRILIAVLAFIWIVGLNAVFASDEKMQHQSHQHDMSMMDTRTSLGVSGGMKQHQLSNMRAHLEAIQSIISLISEDKFKDASKIAHTELGLTPEMQKMCSMFNNEKYMTMGMAFHKSGDDLGDVLNTKDAKASLRALNKTMQYCVECHATYRQ